MRKRTWRGLAALVVIALASALPATSRPGVGGSLRARASGPSSSSATTSTARASAIRFPVRFEANAGQWPERVRFVGRGSGGATLLLTDVVATFVFRDPRAPRHRFGRNSVRQGAAARSSAGPRSAAVTMRLVGDGPAPPRGEEELVTKSNFFLGNDPTRWRTGVPNFGRVRRAGGLPGVSVVWRGGEEGLEYDLEVASRTDASRVEFEIAGANDLAVRPDGTLQIATDMGTLEQKPPRVVQAGRVVRARYRLDGARRVGFDLEAYDATQPVLIDPVLAYSTYLGGEGTDEGTGVAVDASGNAYVTGITDSEDFPAANPIEDAAALPDEGSRPTGSVAFVCKLSASGSTLLYSTYLGGTDFTQGYAIAVDSEGSAYVTGDTASSDFPTASAALSKYPGGYYAAFVTKLSASGSALAYSTFLGGSVWDTGEAIAVDSTGSACIAGETESPDFPTVNAAQGTYGGSDADDGDAFVTRLSPAGSALVYSTYLGGSAGDFAHGVAVDTEGNAYVAGATGSTNFPTANPIQSTLAGGDDAFVTKLAPSGALLFSTYLGGSSNEMANGVAVDSAGSAVIGGWTLSVDFPTVNALQPKSKGAPRPAPFAPLETAFVTKLSPSGSAFAYSTYLGGSGGDEGNGIAVDPAGSAYLVGFTYSTDFPTVDPPQPKLRAMTGSSNAFVTQLNPAGTAILGSTYLGGSDNDIGQGIAVDSSGNAYIVGEATSTDFPTVHAEQAMIGNTQCCLSDAFVAKLSFGPGDSEDPTEVAPLDSNDPGDAAASEAKDAGAGGELLDGSPSVHGSVGADAGSPVLVRGGCACEVGGSGANPGPLGWGALGLVAVIGRRRSKSAGRRPRRDAGGSPGR
jgi:Beta-propeller repeat